MGKRITVSFDIELPEEAAPEHIHEWLNCELIGGIFSINSNNPLRKYDVVAYYPSLIWKESQD